MGKTLIINGADFSGVSIGKVVLPRELSSKAIEWIEASGNNELTNTQKFAIDDFITAIGVETDNSVWSKLDKMFLPMLANDLGHSLIDYKNNYVAASPANINNLVYRNHGVAPSSNPVDIYAVYLDTAYLINCQNCSLFMMNSEPYSTLAAGSSANRGGIGSQTTNMQYRMQQTPTAMRRYAFSTTYDTEVTPNLTPKLTGCIGTSGAMKILDSKGSLITQSPVNNSFTGLSIMQYNGNRLVDATGPAIGVYIAGKALSTEEVTLLKTAVEELFSAINV